MHFIENLNLVPLWIIMLLFAGVLVVSMMLGRWLRRFVGVDPATVASGQLLFGSVSILTLLIGFTFSLALNRHDQRRDLLLEEANAIRALHRTLVHVESPGRDQIADALHRYAQGRLAFVESNLVRQEAQRPARADEREQLNNVVVAVVPVSDAGISQVQILAAATRILDAGARMEQVMLAHVPPRVVLVIYLLSSGAALIVGLSLGGNLEKLWLVVSIWSFMFSLAIFTIVDLDSPHWGSIRLDPAPLQMAMKVTASE